VVPPGTYTVRVKAGSAEQTTQVTVLPDPHSPGTPQTIQAQVSFARGVLAEIDEAATMGNKMEALRKQAQDAAASVANDPSKHEVVQAATAFDAKASAVESRLIDLRNTGRSEDAFRKPVQLYERISWMVGQMLGTPGSGTGGADVGPTAQQVAVNAQFKQELAAIAADYKKIIDEDAPAFAALLKRNGVVASVVP
jgi:hypothetical protein